NQVSNCTLTGSSVWYEYDVTSFISTEKSGDGIASIAVNEPNFDQAWVVYSSRESSNAPELIVTLLPDPVTPSIPSNVVTSISGTDLVIDWDVSADATSYDVYSSDDPYGTFIFVTNVGTNQYTISITQAKLFYYIIAKN
ncbi:MAG: hypothetical protein GQ534_10140, partial [Candidatus Delongbacteria bacterium]|nr:hypothetical protein [Candidatus Delongbacteria bacterium]